MGNDRLSLQGKEERESRGEIMSEITVVIPAYNAEKYIAQTLDSIHKQTVKPRGILVINDGSIDETESVIKKWEYENNYLVDVIPRANAGIGATRQFGAEHAKGDYVAFLSSDDCYSPTFLEESLKLLSPNSATFTNYWQCDSRLKPFSLFSAPYGDMKENCIKWALEKNMFVNFSTVIIPKNVFETTKFLTELRHGEDLIFLLDTITHGLNWQCIRKPLLYYRIHKGQGTNLKLVAEWKALWDNIDISLQKLGVEQSTITSAREANFKHLFEKSNTSVAKGIARSILNTIPYGQKLKKQIKGIKQ
jgi:glycosyltransferase involved in cell wall biosynthesis